MLVPPRLPRRRHPRPHAAPRYPTEDLTCPPTLLIALVWAAAVAGDVVSLLLGRRFGRPFLDIHGSRLRILLARAIRTRARPSRGN